MPSTSAGVSAKRDIYIPPPMRFPSSDSTSSSIPVHTTRATRRHTRKRDGRFLSQTVVPERAAESSNASGGYTSVASSLPSSSDVTPPLLDSPCISQPVIASQGSERTTQTLVLQILHPGNSSTVTASTHSWSTSTNFEAKSDISVKRRRGDPYVWYSRTYLMQKENK